MHAHRALRIASTIGPIETGLLPALEIAFAQQSSLSVEHEALGTGAALERAKRGGVDIVIAHAPALEQQFVSDGWAIDRYPFAANDFVLLGPGNDPAGARRATGIVAALGAIAGARAPFVSRGDRSGTHVKEQELWAAAGGLPIPCDWYRVARSGPAGSGAAASEAAEQRAYTLVDRATFVTTNPQLVIVSQGDPRLLNVLSALPVNPRRAADVNDGGAEAFVEWLLGDAAQTIIGDFGRAAYGVPLFLRRDHIPTP